MLVEERFLSGWASSWKKDVLYFMNGWAIIGLELEKENNEKEEIPK